MGIVLEEIDESLYWMEMLVEAGMIRKESLAGLMDEADQIIAMAAASIKTARGKLK